MVEKIGAVENNQNEDIENISINPKNRRLRAMLTIRAGIMEKRERE